MKIKIYHYVINEKKIYFSYKMSRLDITKAQLNKCKFIENTQRIIGSTNKIIKELMEEHEHIRTEYASIPGLLELGNTILVNLPDDKFEEIITDFFTKSIPVWDKIKNKDITVLTENMSLILSNNQYVPKIQYMYGANEDNLCYVSEKDTKNMWNLITALIHNSVKYVIFSDNKDLLAILPPNTVETWKINLE